ncbi:MAG: DUF2797 domain-containing protein [Gammaproteobacteria bacterium]|nr:MAG: DUF2797 domain-containing protein [Gammaproteobacteria bacterium]
MPASGQIRKLRASLETPVRYRLPIGASELDMNACLGKSLRLEWSGEIRCLECDRPTRKSFSQGHCYPCMQRLASCDLCIVRPEKCHYHEGTCREPKWGQDHCMQPHYVYLANSSGIKVGITRHTQIPTRWIDQGAVQALPVLKVKSRYISGLVEVALKPYVADRTDWRRMLKGEPDKVDLIWRRDELFALVGDQLNAITQHHGEDAWHRLDDEIVEIQYPVETYPDRVSSINLDKTPAVSGILQGIKGQYLILDTGVLNIRKYGGYILEIA